MMEARALAEMLLTIRKMASRTGCAYQLRENAVTGLSPDEEVRVMDAVNDIEKFTEERLSRLDLHAPSIATAA